MPRVFRQGTLEKVIPISPELTTLIIFRRGQDMRRVNIDALLLDHHRSVFHGTLPDISLLRLRRRSTPGIADGLQKPRTNLWPTDQQQWSDRIKGSLPGLTGQQRISHVQRQSRHTGDNQ
ncbi:hypothetical protein [Streptomyces violaceusniger]|uniref:Uncharacterized protein n=1 Tax=Streptomyces violaceusniger TaxID=68280 RepID=A0A4D4LGX8_STRVO|nr:hypothetical protein SVIO_083400 [Streptomyces violaceusniger]